MSYSLESGDWDPLAFLSPALPEGPVEVQQVLGAGQVG